MTQASLEQGAPRHATVQMQQAVTDTQDSVTTRDVRKDGPETTVKVTVTSFPSQCILTLPLIALLDNDLIYH